MTWSRALIDMYWVVPGGAVEVAEEYFQPVSGDSGRSGQRVQRL